MMHFSLNQMDTDRHLLFRNGLVRTTFRRMRECPKMAPV